LYAKSNTGFQATLFHTDKNISFNGNITLQHDTTVTKNKQRQSDEDKKKIKEIAKAKKMPKPEKIESVDPAKPKPKRQRRPEGLERPPEIPRRND
jgi:regulatory protein YycH of two-component signal transduction system YycFG